VNPESQQLWLEYFKLELLWVEKIKERRKVLFGEKLLTNGTENNVQEENVASDEEKDEDALDLPELDIEKKAKQSSNSTAFELGSIGTKGQLNATQTALLELVIPRTVYRNAIRSIAKDIDFRLKFLDVYLQFTGSEIGINEVYESISADFKTPQAIAIIAGRSVKGVSQSDPQFPMALKAAVTLFEEHLVELMSPDFCEMYANFLSSLSSDCTEPHLIKYLAIVLERLYEKAESLKLMTDTMYAQWADRIPDESESIILKGFNAFPSSQLLWLKKLSASATLKDFKQALSYVKGESSYPIWTSYLDLLISQCNNQTRKGADSDDDEDSDMEDVATDGIFIQDVTKAFVLALSPTYLDATALEFEMSGKFLEWILSVSGIEGVRKAGKHLVSLKPRHAPFYSAWIKLEMAQPAFDKARISKLYEASIDSDPMNMSKLYPTLLRIVVCANFA
jgi:U3 small nucleolar RNA-associated protein 6